MKRAIALFLALIFVFTLIPVSALATGERTIELYYDDTEVETALAAGTTVNSRTVVPGEHTAFAAASEGKGTLSSDNRSVTLQALPQEGKTFQYWQFGSSSTQVTASRQKIPFNVTDNVAVSAVYADTVQTVYDIEGPDSVVVSVKDKDSTEFATSSEAKVGDLVRVRVNDVGDGTNSRLKGITASGVTGTDIKLISESQDEDGQKYKLYEFPMPAQDVEIHVAYEYLVSLSGAEIHEAMVSGTTEVVTNGTFWADGGSTVSIELTGASIAGRTISSWSFDPSVTFTYIPADKSKAQFTMPGEALDVRVNYLTAHSYVIQSVLYDTDVTAPADIVTRTQGTALPGETVTVPIPQGDTGWIALDDPNQWESSPAVLAGWDVTTTPGSLKFTMPDQDATVKRFFVKAYALTLAGETTATVGGAAHTSGGTVKVGEKVKVTAKANTDSQVFDYWQYAPESSRPAGATEDNKTAVGASATTEFDMPIGDVTVTAHYKYKVTLTNGTLSNGASSGLFAPGETVTVIANVPSVSTRVFRDWTVLGTPTPPADFDATDLADAGASTTSFTMPKGAVALQANEDEAHRVRTTTNATIKRRSSTTSGNEIVAAAGTLLTATANATANGIAFKEWQIFAWGVNISTGSPISGPPPVFASLGITAADLSNRTLNFQMATTDYQLIPKYEGTAYQVSVTGGTGTGYYAEGANVTIAATEVTGKKFLSWTLTKYLASGTVTETALGSSYTFEMPACTVTASPNYEQLYSVTLTNNNDYMKTADAEGDLSMTRPAAAATADKPAVAEKKVANAAGETSVSDYWSVGDVLTITTPVDEKIGAEFTGWVIVSGSGTIADASKATTTFTVTAANTVIAARYGGNMLLYKDAERLQDPNAWLPTYRYDEWTYADVAPKETVVLKADDPNGTFAGWSTEPADLISDADKANRQITFKMPEGTVKVWPEYNHTLKLTDAEYSLDGGTTWTMGGGETAPVNIPSGAQVTLRPVEKDGGNEGQYIFSSWNANSTRIGVQSTTKQISFIMPPENLTVSVNYQVYALTVRRYVDSSIVEEYYLRPGEYLTLENQEATGGRYFSDWSNLNVLGYYTLIDHFDPKDSTRLMNQTLTLQMPAYAVSIQANYGLYPRYDYWSTGAFIEIKNEPKRYYGLLEYFDKSLLEVYYYANASATGVPVSPTDLTCRVVYPGTNNLATDIEGCFVGTGQFELLVDFYVNGTQMVPTLRTMNTASSYITCYDIRPEYVRNFNQLNRKTYYEGETVSKDGLDVWLVSADHISGAPQYFSVRELAESEYTLYTRDSVTLDTNNLITSVDGATTKLPTIAEIQAALAAGKAGYRVETDRYGVTRYYVQMWVYAVDQAQTTPDGKYVIMQYLVNNASDAIWAEVRAGINNVQLTAAFGNNSDTVNNVPGTVYPHTSWEITQGSALGERTLTISSDNWTGTPADLAAAIEILNSDPNVAYLEPILGKPLQYKVIVKTPGVTTITVRARGDAETAVKATCEITVRSNTDPTPMVSFGLPTAADGHAGGLNKSQVSLFVGNKITLYPTEFSPSNASPICNWEVEFNDNLLPQNADYYVSVSSAGVVEVLKYTDRPVRVYAYPAYPVGANTKAQRATCLYSYCDIDVLEIPVDNMTMYPTAVTMYRLASRQMKVTLYPEAASDKTITWSSSDSNVASVSPDGVITANMLGTATITAKSSNADVYQTCAVTVLQSTLLTNLMLNKTSATLGLDDTIVLTPYYTPATATTQTVTWTSSDPAVATVDSNGKVRGISEGAAVIRATSNDGSGKTASCVVSVTTIVTSAVVLNKQTLALIEDETETLSATVYPTNVSNSKVTWSSSNEKVATVDPDGVVTGTGGGSAVITATAKDTSTKYADCVVAVTAKIPVTAITLNQENFDMLLNDTTILKETVAPANATYKPVWTSSDPAVATIDENGKVSGLTTGTTIITCKAGDMTKSITLGIVTKVYSSGKVVNCSRRVNVRANSSGTSAILGFAYLGDVYKVLDRTGNWYKIQYNATTTGYIWSRYLSATETTAGYVSAGKVGSTTTDPTGTATPAPAVTAKSLTITNCSYCVNVRAGAGTNTAKLGYAYKDEVFTYTGTSGDWYVITYNGATAYVSSQFVKVN